MLICTVPPFLRRWCWLQLHYILQNVEVIKEPCLLAVHAICGLQGSSLRFSPSKHPNDYCRILPNPATDHCASLALFHSLQGGKWSHSQALGYESERGAGSILQLQEADSVCRVDGTTSVFVSHLACCKEHSGNRTFGVHRLSGGSGIELVRPICGEALLVQAAQGVAACSMCFASCICKAWAACCSS